MANFSVSYSFKAIDEFSAVAKKIGDNFDTIAKKAEQSGAKVRAFGEKMTKMGKSMSLKVTAPLVAAGVLSLRTADKFEQSMERMRVSAHLTDKQFASLSNQAKTLGATTDFTASQVASAQGKMADVGFKYTQIAKAMPPAITLASATMMDLGDASEITARIMKGYNFTGEQMNSVNDKLAVVASQTNMDLGALSKGLGKVKSTADAAGMSFTDTLSILSALDKQGIDVRQGLSGLREGLQYIINPSKQAVNFFKAIHVSLKDVHGKMRPLTAILADFKKNVVPSMREQAAFIAFGNTAGSVMNSLMDGLPAVNDYKKALNDHGLASKLAAVDMKDLSGAEIRLKNNTNLLAISFGDKLKPMAVSLLDGFAKLEGKLSATSGTAKTLVGGFAFVAMSIGPILLVVGKFLVVLALISDKVPLAAAALKFLGGSFRFLWRSVFLPIAVITTLITVFDLAYKHIKIFRNAIDATAKVITNFFKHISITSPLMTVLKLMISHVSTLHSAMATTARAVPTTAGGAKAGGATGASLLKPSSMQAGIMSALKSSIDINIHDPNGNVKSVSGKGDHDMKLNLGSGMAYSRI